MVYLWTEDRQDKSGYLFWKNLMGKLFPEVCVESKINNNNLIKAVERIDDSQSRYLIAIDHPFDNPQIVREIHKLREKISGKENVVELKIISFEYILLEFDKLLDWIYTPTDEYRTKREKTIIAREKLVNALKNDLDYKKEIKDSEYIANLENYNVEQLAAKILFELTRNTGFEVSKATLGNCWINDCCHMIVKTPEDECGLDDARLTVKNKMKLIYEGTSLRSELAKAGLEVNQLDHNL